MNVIEAEEVWKRFPQTREHAGFKEFLVTLPKLLFRKNKSPSFWALKGISFTVKQGQCVGVIGKNGAGKSTLLSLILGTVYPNRGSIKVSQKVTPLLELGAGFHPDLTGRENILINGVLLGLTKKEVEERIDDIINFSEIREFIDSQVRTYSSGMYLRLAFSVAIHADPQLFLIDEILAVGDESFHRKSREALLRLIKSGVTTLLVSHDLVAVKEICDKVIWIDGGRIRVEGEPEKVIDEYVGYARS